LGKEEERGSLTGEKWEERERGEDILQKSNGNNERHDIYNTQGINHIVRIEF
jgi:hypothetical protein